MEFTIYTLINRIFNKVYFNNEYFMKKNAYTAK